MTRESAEEDRRGAYAVLTRKGSTDFARALRSHVALVRKRFLSLYSERELQQMGALWQRHKAQDASSRGLSGAS